MVKKQFFIIVFLLLSNYFSIAQSNSISQRVYNTSKIVGSAPVIDGKVDEDCWQAVAWSGGFTQREPYEYAAPTQKTKFKILYDDNNLYVAIRAFDDNPSKIEKRLSRRDSFEGDWVAVSLDSYDDNLTGFGFSVSAAGVKGDVIITNDNKFDDTWNPVWYVKVSVDDLGWMAEMKIPLSQLRFAKKQNHDWGLEVMRQLFRKDEFSVWQMVPLDASGWVSMWGRLQGIDNISPKKEVELIPYVMGSLEKGEKIEGNPFATGTTWGYNVGLDGKIAVTNDLTLNFTINPDFGQVEADPSNVNLSGFESYFAEKRPFFIEGSNIFNFPLTSGHSRDNLFYSRRIGRRPHYYPDLDNNEYVKMPQFTRILGAFKLSGKTRNGWSIGVMESMTNKTLGVIDSLGARHDEVVEPLTNFFNTRIQKDFNDGNTSVGGMVTATNRFINDSTLNFLPRSAYTAGLDFTNYWLDRSYYIKAKAVASSVSGDSLSIIELQEAPQRYYQRPDNEMSVDSSLTAFSGFSGSFEAGKSGGGNWRYGIRTTWLSPSIAINDMGYLRVADAINQSGWGEYIIFTPVSIFRKVNFRIVEWTGWDNSGRFLSSGLRLSTDIQFVNYWGTDFGLRREGTDVDRSELHGGPALIYYPNLEPWLSFHTNSRKKLVFSVSGSVDMGKYNTKLHQDVDFSLSYRPTNAIQISITPALTVDYDRYKHVDAIDDNDVTKYIVGSLIRHEASMDIRINFSITPDLSIQYWGQPFLFTADYGNFAKVVDAGNFSVFDQYYNYSGDEISYDKPTDSYTVVDGQESFTFDNPNFSVYEYRSNFVLRWEYIPGSTFYAVWSQGREGYDESGIFDINDNVNSLVNVVSSNIFLLKFSYRISM